MVTVQVFHGAEIIRLVLRWPSRVWGMERREP